MHVNILFFLRPKSDVAVICSSMLVEDALRIMRKTNYTALPVNDTQGEYVGTLPQGDLLWYLHDSKDMKRSVLSPIKAVPRLHDNASIPVSTDMESLLNRMLEQNFAPVTDDRGVFIGIVTRRSIMEYFMRRLDSLIEEEK